MLDAELGSLRPLLRKGSIVGVAWRLVTSAGLGLLVGGFSAGLGALVQVVGVRPAVSTVV